MPHRTAQLSYSNLHDYWRWGLTPLENGTPRPRSIRWRTAWFLETAFPKEGQNVLYLGLERNMDFEKRFIRKCFSAKWEGSVTLMLVRPSQGTVDLALPNFEILYQPAGQNLPFADASFDRIYCANILNLIAPAHQTEYLRDIRRLLTPNGILCLSAAYLIKARIDAETHEIGGFSRIPQYAPNAKNWLEALDVPPPYNAGHFPGFSAFDEDRLLHAEDLLIDGMNCFPPFPERDQSLSYIEMGLSITASPIRPTL